MIEAGEVIDATGEHTGGSATCTSTAVCEVCGNSYGDKDETNHVGETETKNEKEVTCGADGYSGDIYCKSCEKLIEAGEVINATGEHTGGSATCTSAAVCEVCGNSYGDKDESNHAGETETKNAEEATCGADGYSGDIYCKSCEKLIEAGEVLPATGEHTGGTATCTKLAVCETCNQEYGDFADHDYVHHEAKIATYSTVGWDAYDTCSNCDYSTYVEIPVLEKPVITDYATFMNNLVLLEELAALYVQENPGKDPAALVIKYIRTGVDRYNSGSWNIMAGYEDAGFAEYVLEMEEMVNSSATSQEALIAISSLKDIEEFDIPNGDHVDFGHMFGTMDITYHNKSSVNHADVAGWAGDLVDLLSTIDRHGVTGTLDEMITDISDNYLCHSFDEDDIFSQKDMYGDLDGFYIMEELYNQEYETGTLYNIINAYFTESLTDEERAAYFLENRLDGVTSRIGIREAVFDEYTGNKVVATLEGTREFAATDLSDMRKACCYSFADYLCKLAGDWVEFGENNYYSVFETESSTLAPGITQEISKATTADGKQIVYYIATADINSDYVNVYANYKDNDPTSWGMARVLDQANAAQAKYGDPESEYYIPNYNVIASINADGFNMSTGEPGGLLVMNGVEYHAVDGGGFFGILKDGTAVIGSQADYNAMKDEVQEGVGGFGTTLVKDGKVTITATSDYYNSRASRTAVGITRTGKVVFMVLDGRQEPFSCGGSMQEIAQIMMEAGCVEAINLDGGGSTTFVAKQEGEDELSVVNSPSDGFQRSVSTSLMMVSTAPSETAFDHALIEAESNYLTTNTSVQITASGVSATGNTAELPEGTTWAVSDARWGTITEDGVFTGLRLGDVDVYLMLGEEIIGTKTMHVVTPDNVYFSKTNMDAVYGETVTLPVVALYSGKTVAINASDLVFTMSNDTAGTIDGFCFTGDEESGIKNVTITASLAANTAVSGSITIALYNQGEATFDFDQAIGGDRLLAWDRQVSNATTEDDMTYYVKNLEEPMETSYIFAIDMTQIPIPEELADLTYMLPGADAEGASAWSFLLQLAERVSVLTEVKPVIQFDSNFDVDYSELTIVNEYFELNNAELDEETNKLTLTLNWMDQTAAIDPATANPICIVSGIKLTPKEDAAWDSKERLAVENSGEISYTIYLRANALYSFAQKEENQNQYNLYPFENPDVIIGGSTEKGAYFGDVYAEFSDSYTLVNSLKNGWVYEENGYAYYVEGEKLTGVQQVNGFYYDFGESGINIGQTKYTGLFEIDGKNYYAKNGVITSGWITISGDSYCFDENGAGYDGKVMIDEIEMEFDNGLLIGGYTGFVEKSDGNIYHYVNGKMTYGWYQDGETWYHFNTTTGVMTTGTKVCPDAEAKNKNAYYDFAEDGKLLRAYFNPIGYYYWAGLPLCDAWVKNGADSDPDAWYRTNSSGHYVTDLSAEPTIQIPVDGVWYTFDNTNGKLLEGRAVSKNGSLYYYWAGEILGGGWFEINGKTYYAYEDNHLAVGTVAIDGENYTFTNEGVLVTENTTGSVPMYRLFNPNSGEHFYTGSSVERDNLVSVGWNYEGVAFNAPVKGTPLYRLYNPYTSDHHYTMSQVEIDNLVAVGWIYEGACWNSASPVEIPQYRLFNPYAVCGTHHYTGSIEERDYLVSRGWKYEGIGWYGTLK